MKRFRRIKMAEVKFALTITVMLIVGIADANSCDVDNDSMRCTGTFPQFIPSHVVSVFVSQLRTDTMPEYFHNDSWKQVTSLDINLHDNADGIHIRNFTFVNLSSLRQLGLHGQPYFSLEKSAFHGLDLVQLDLSGCTTLSDKQVKQALLPGDILPSLKSLKLDGINTKNFETFTMDADYFQMLHHKNMLTNVSLRGTNLIFDGSNVDITHASNNITHLDISWSSIVIQSNVPNHNLFFRDYVFPSLESLNISFLQIQFSVIIPLKDQIETYCKPGDETNIEGFLKVKQLYANGILRDIFDVKNSSIDISDCIVLLNSIQFQNNKLRTLDVNFLLPKEHNVLNIDVSFNEIEFLSPNISKKITEIEILDLGNNRLFKMERTEFFCFLFNTLTKLKELSLKRNQLRSLPYKIFQHNKRLRILDLSGNIFETISFKIDHLSALEKLDLRNNRIKAISDLVLEDVKKLLHQASLRDILLSDNIFECTCESYAFIYWLQREHTDNNFQCYIEGRVTDFGETVVSETKFLCYKNIVILFSSLFGYVAIVSTLIALYMRYRRKAVEGTQAFLNDFKSKKLNDINWMGMVSYSSEDGDIVIKHIYDALQKCLKTMLDVPFNVICNNEIDFEAGMDVAAEIVRCVSESCVLIVAVSESYCNKHWCSREVEEAYKQGKPIILVFLEHVDEDKMPPFLRKIFQRYTRVKMVNVNGEYTMHPPVENVSKSIIRLAEQSFVFGSVCKIC